MRDLTFTKAKAIGILAVVVGHSGCPQVIHDFIYCFHMPLFFMIAGYFFKESNIYNMRHYLLQKIKRLYVPYVTFSLSFIVSHNFWYDLGITEGVYSLREFAWCIVKAVTMTKPGALVGPLWFLKSLLVSLVLMCVVSRLTAKCGHKLIIRLCIVLCALLIVAIKGDRCLVSYMWNRDLAAFSLVFMGYLANRFKVIDRMNNSRMGGVLLILLFALSFYSHLDLSGMKFENIPFLLFVSIVGFLSILWVSRYLPSWSLILKIGDCTMTVLIWHFFFMRIAKLIFDNVLVVGYDAQLRQVEWHNQQYWFIYSLMSVIGCYCVIKINDLTNKYANTN